MIEAGHAKLMWWESDLTGSEFDEEVARVLTEIYKAMWKASLEDTAC
jgi:hypothetical protein